MVVIVTTRATKSPTDFNNKKRYHKEESEYEGEDYLIDDKSTSNKKHYDLNC